MTHYQSEYSEYAESLPKGADKHTIENLLDGMMERITRNVSSGREESKDEYFLVLKLSILKLKENVSEETVEQEEFFDLVLDFLDLYIRNDGRFK